MTMPEEYIETINGIPLKASLDIDALRDEVSLVESHCLFEVQPEVTLELGSMTINTNGWTYSNSQTRLRMPRNVTVHLRPGDSFGLSEEATLGQYCYYGYEKNGVYYVPQARWVSLAEPVVAQDEGNYVFILRAVVDGETLEGDDLIAAYDSFFVNQYTNFAGDTKTAVDAVSAELEDVRLDVLDKSVVSPEIQLGGIAISANGWIYHTADNRARIPQGTTYHLIPGDAVGFSDLTDRPAFGYGYRTDEGYQYPEDYWIYRGRLDVEEEGDYVFCFRTYANTTGDTLLDSLTSFYIEHTSNLVGDVKNVTDELGDNVAKLMVNGQVEHSETYWSVGHQGYKYTAPKSTEASYAEARRMGYRYAENDFRLSSDGQPVMWHDVALGSCGNLYDINGYVMYTDGTDFYGYDEPNETLYILGSDGEYSPSSVDVETLAKLAGSDVAIANNTAAVLRRFDVGRYRGMEFAGQKILTFYEWILLCKKLGLNAYVDRKVNWDSVAEDLVDYARHIGMLEHISWCVGGLGGSAESIRTYDPDARLIVFSAPTDESLAYYDQLDKGRGISYFMSTEQCTAENIQKAYDHGYGVDCWYVNIEETAQETVFAKIRELMDLGVQGFVLDRYLVRDAYPEYYA